MRWLHGFGNWLYSAFGIPGTGPRYAFWSGIGSDIGEVTILGGVIAIYRQHTCGKTHCYRIARHPVEGTHHKTCHKHTTQAVHTALHDEHERKFPEVHEFLKQKEPECPSPSPSPVTSTRSSTTSPRPKAPSSKTPKRSSKSTPSTSTPRSSRARKAP